jgi:hypothetical protein
LTAFAGRPEASFEAGVSSLVTTDGQYVYYAGSDLHIHQLYYNHLKWVDEDLMGGLVLPGSISGTQIIESDAAIASLADTSGRHVFYMCGDDQHIHHLHYDNAQWIDKDGSPADRQTDISGYALSGASLTAGQFVGQYIFCIGDGGLQLLSWFNDGSNPCRN